MKKTLIIIIVVLVIGTLTFFMIKTSSKDILSNMLGQSKSQTTNQKIGDKLLNNKAPYFDLSSIDDKRIKSSDFIDKPLIVVFWASWNVESANQLKIIDDYKARNKDNLASIISINSQEDKSVVKSFMRRGGYIVPTAIDTNGSITEDFNIKSLPTTFFIDRDGVIRTIYSGVLSKEMFSSFVEPLLD